MQEARHGRHDASRCTGTLISLPGIPAASSTRGEDPWTTGKDPWAQGRLEAFVVAGRGVARSGRLQHCKACLVRQQLSAVQSHTSNVMNPFMPCPHVCTG